MSWFSLFGASKFPESIAGRLTVPQDGWIPCYGGPAPVEEERVSSESSSSQDVDKDKETASIRSGHERTMTEMFDNIVPSGRSRCIVTLLRYHGDRRSKPFAPLEAMNIKPGIQLHLTSPLSEAPAEELFALPNAPLSALTHIVDIALYKLCLINRPGLLSSLCRLLNWREVSEVEQDLRARKNTYHGQMHEQAFELPQELSADEEDMEDKPLPSVQYLQKLGPEYIGLVFMSEDVNLPRKEVTWKASTLSCVRSISSISLKERQETATSFHDRSAELYLSMTPAAKKRKLYGLVASIVCAILLGRLGRHDQALETYVYRLQDYIKAEEHWKRVYQTGSKTEGIFLTLLRISDMGPGMDSVETLQLLHPLVTTHDIQSSLIEDRRVPVFDTKVVGQISTARNEQVTRRLVNLQSKRVKVTDSRIFCHKRLGNIIIASETTVVVRLTHSQCREQFLKRLRS
ncbi:hypothetical protein CPC08DRAFT_738117 [Agrocybe pediades]|nr:hypothetical protein CPC08DRAFT_738117 [Agrocybe pediades]